MTLISFIAIAVVASMVLIYGFSNTFNLILINPLINALIVLDRLVFGEFGVAIILFTLLVRLATLPFTIRQFQSMKSMQAAQPRLEEVRKKFKDPRKRSEEEMKIMREHGFNPLGCVMPMVIQFGLFFCLYRALVFTMGGSPESLIGLSQRLYPWSFIHESVPLNQHFLWLNLGQPDTTFILPILVGYATYVQQKLSITPNATPQQAQQQQMMTWMMPLILVWISLSLPSGVGVYWVATNIFTLFASYYVYGRRGLGSWWHVLLPLPTPTPAPAPAARSQQQAAAEKNEQSDDDRPERVTAPASKVRAAHGKRRGKRKNRR